MYIKNIIYSISFTLQYSSKDLLQFLMKQKSLEIRNSAKFVFLPNLKNGTRVPNVRRKIRQYIRIFGDICRPLLWIRFKTWANRAFLALEVMIYANFTYSISNSDKVVITHTQPLIELNKNFAQIWKVFWFAFFSKFALKPE